jgi:putative endonuclease
MRSAPAKAVKLKAYRSGVLAEALVGLLYRLKGFRVLSSRYRTPVGELDLVTLRGRRLVFVEVKRRRSAASLAWTVPTRQRRRIVRAAQYWLAGHPRFHNHDMRFDVVLTAPWRLPEIVENAFEL